MSENMTAPRSDMDYTVLDCPDPAVLMDQRCARFCDRSIW